MNARRSMASEYSEFYFTHAVYDHAIHPQWDDFGSNTLYLKILYADYDDGFVVIEFIGEWNDLLHNDIMFLKRDIVEVLMAQGINKFILVGENVLNFHSSDESYYEEWWDDVEDAGGWIALLNFRAHVLEDIQAANIDQYFLIGGRLNELDWRTQEPEELFERVEAYVRKRIGT